MKSNEIKPSEIAGYGSWKSPITSDLIVSKAIGLRQVSLDGEDIYWIESRPSEGGRNVLVRRSTDGRLTDITPAPFNVRTTVHEYGGGDFLVDKGVIYFSNYADQRLYRQESGTEPRPITPEINLRYADYIMDSRQKRLICVSEDHRGNSAVNSLVTVELEAGGEVKPLVSGHDFFSSPRLSPDGKYLAWLTWDHPNMPWDSNELWISEVESDGSIVRERKIAGGPDESICQPEFSPDGILYFVSDRTGWWNLYRWKDEQAEPLYTMKAEFGEPQWVFGKSNYSFASADHIICTYIQEGISYLGSLDLTSLHFKPINNPYTTMAYVKATPGYAFMIAGSPVQSTAVVRLDLDNGKAEVLRRSSSLDLDTGYLSIPQSIEYPTGNGLTAHAFFYPPKNRDFVAPAGEKPPLLVSSHGGPTGAATNTFNLTIQYWTSRGLAVVDVNYGGSTGFGRVYHQRLNGQWGIVDVEDCINAARYLIQRGDVDPERTAIRGGSAGGYTTLCALTFHHFFRTGASYYGLGDLEADVKNTHKFESRYSDTLVGRYPERRDLYFERSPINFVDRISSPVIFFHGTEDKIVTPDQSEKMVEALRRKKLPVAYLLFEHEQHGFRIAANIKRSLEAELYFYSKILGFEADDSIDPVEIENLDRFKRG